MLDAITPPLLRWRYAAAMLLFILLMMLLISLFAAMRFAFDALDAAFAFRFLCLIDADFAFFRFFFFLPCLFLRYAITLSIDFR